MKIPTTAEQEHAALVHTVSYHRQPSTNTAKYHSFGLFFCFKLMAVLWQSLSTYDWLVSSGDLYNFNFRKAFKRRVTKFLEKIPLSTQWLKLVSLIELNHNIQPICHRKLRFKRWTLTKDAVQYRKCYIAHDLYRRHIGIYRVGKI